MFASVIVDIAHSDVDKIFEYSFSDKKITRGSRVVVPFGAKIIEGIVIDVREVSEFPPEKIKPIIRLLEQTPALNEETLALSEYVSKKCMVSRAMALRLFLPSEMRKGRVKEKFTRVAELKADFDLDATKKSLKKNAKNQLGVLEYLEQNGRTACSKLNSDFGSQAVKALESKGVVVIVEDKYYRAPYKQLAILDKSVKLTDSQQNAVQSVLCTDKTTSLIHGVTGSGKTEVYLSLIERTINEGKTAIMLVPEIALTPQMLKQLRGRFLDSAAILHSGLSAGERFDEWWRLRNGDAKIAIGARSAVFAPLENVGLIIIDEEHDGSYTSDTAPRYSTLDVAKFRVERCGGKLVLGSATPSIISYKNAIDGEYNYVEMPERINKRALPDIEIVDMRKEIRRGNNSPFSQALICELEECLKNGNQAMLFLNQRGYSKSVICTECGHVQKCEFCDVSLTYHKEDESLLCHYCGAKYKMITACTECGSRFIRYGGTGTERVVDELKKIFPSSKILRMDRDTTQNKESHFKILEDFASRKADILVGTQMIAKGHDFSNVTLVGILDADMSLHFSDFRSGERTYQLITQVAGRAGRADSAGKVVLQTYSPDNAVLKRAVRYDYKGLAEHELSIRKATGFPPYSSVVRVLISSSDEQTALDKTKQIYQKITNEVYEPNREEFRFYGCMKAPIKKLQSMFRFQILMRIDEGAKGLIERIFQISNEFNSKSLFVSLEINPNNLN